MKNKNCPKCKIPVIDSGCFRNEELEKRAKKKEINYIFGLRRGPVEIECVKCGEKFDC